MSGATATTAAAAALSIEGMTKEDAVFHNPSPSFDSTVSDAPNDSASFAG